ncbi:MAG: argininosuccinate lyase, partial [Salinivirgaceae bacterium]|nr:argininosuccinate lyase [Salinivirgaceae bacterium]
KQVAFDIKDGRFVPETHINHTHEGSIGNLCNDQIDRKFAEVSASFDFASVEAAVNSLVK